MFQNSMLKEESWNIALRTEYQKQYFTHLIEAVDYAFSNSTVYPPQSEIFAAFNLCPLPNVRVVILGQDPYHGAGQAHGLAFSVHDGVTIPPSLRNILKEIASDIGVRATVTSDLSSWANQGVLLLNSTLTVEKDKASSHQRLGWEQFTDTVITTISETSTNVVFLLWGAFAEKKRSLIDESKHLVLTAPHPSPLSAYRGFFGCRHFSTANSYLQKNGQSPIIW